ncbi:TetR/AcrR family transcriptional regulator [Mycobacteroides salmoniphilum]|uniref:HTH-type transcriptional repressor KstR2 n=1 Tax=Mycobacteroides salmoniphilum TaxID=404941 RepID=A0A4R8SKR3_9MYCO|nr:TetR/AcrR family transcriptional regulator [Mycobacteroides salmoniphilum]TDZ98235.1 HTH-type transcriptional repressor KstR2 [Mycobacteroides salmoniphilum]TEA02765.1 HTH-type transcriptional repressor KstR2 [Mycobacteroides salmoniphilum]
MSGQRQRISRAESQQRTREELLDAAEELFLANGLGGTTVTKIADAAGRTVGAIYSNFSSKENLCAEVLLRCYMRTFSEVAGKLIQSASSIDDQITQLAHWSAALSGDEGLVALAAEYALAIHKDQAQLAVSQGHIAMGRNLLGAALASALPDTTSDDERDAALTAVLATAAGLALGRTLGTIDDAQYVDLLTRTLRLWIADLRQSPNASS